ncbi:MAG: thiolase family protein [Gemmatimonadales bacterium]
MKIEGVAVLGTAMTRFADHRDRTLVDLATQAGLDVLADAGIDLRQVGEAYVGSMLAPPMYGVRIMKQLGLTGLPVVSIEAASASGLVALREATFAVASGRCEVALALAYEHAMVRLPGSGGMVPGYESLMASPASFALWASRRMHERGTRPEHLAILAARSWNAARRNPLAYHQADHVVTPEEILASPLVATPLTQMMGAPMGGGAAAALVARDGVVRRLRPGHPLVRVCSTALVTESYAPGWIAVGPSVGPPEMTAAAARLAYDSAGIGPEDLDLVLLHDSWINEELEYYEQLGLCDVGDAEKLAEEGATAPGGRIPVSTDGGLLARGHPVGPTGLAQVHEIALQLCGRAGPRQVAGARTALAHLVGGGSSAIVSLFQREG